MKLTRYQPKTADRELVDFVNDTTDLINGGRISVPTSTTTPGVGSSQEGEFRMVYVSSNDVRLYCAINGLWWPIQMGRVIQSGWGYIQISGTPAAQTAALTFPSAFSTAPFVMISGIGVNQTTVPTSPDDFDNALTKRIWTSYAPSTTGCTVAIYTGDGSALNNGDYEGFAWQAISA